MMQPAAAYQLLRQQGKTKGEKVMKTPIYDDIVKALERGDMSNDEIAKATGHTKLQIRNAIASARQRKRQTPLYVVGYLGPRDRIAVYSLTQKSKPAQKKHLHPRYAPEFETMSPHDYDLYAGRNLAMLAR